MWVVIEFIFLMFILKESMSRGGAEREGRERIPRRLCGVSTEPNVGLDLTNHEIMNWAKIKESDTWGTWMAQSVKHRLQLRSWFHGSWVQARIRLCAVSLELGACFRFCVSFLCPFPTHPLSLSLSKINKKI